MYRQQVILDHFLLRSELRITLLTVHICTYRLLTLQYPEAANLFANVRRPYRPTPWQEWRRTWLTSTIGILLIFGAFGFVLWNEVKIP